MSGRGEGRKTLALLDGRFGIRKLDIVYFVEVRVARRSHRRVCVWNPGGRISLAPQR